MGAGKVVAAMESSGEGFTRWMTVNFRVGVSTISCVIGAQ